MDIILQMQESHGGWNPEMEECFIGPCRIIQENNKDSVIQAPSGNHYRVNSGLLRKYNQFKNGDIVQVTQDEELLQKNHSYSGISKYNMRQLANQKVEIIRRNQDGNYKIKWNNKDWIINPKCFNECKDDKELKEGDKVKLIKDPNQLKILQENHGGWCDIMSVLAGKEVEIVKILSDGDCYISGLGMVWLINTMAIDKSTKRKSSQDSEAFKNGDSVKISNDTEKTKALQEYNGGWVQKMEECAGKTGIVHKILPTGAVIVKVNKRKFAYNPKLLTKISENFKIPKFCQGDIVQVISNKDKVKKLQEGHGEWIENMEILLGQIGKVKSIDLDGDLRVKIMYNTITLNPKCVEKVETDTDSDSDSNDLEEVMNTLTKLFEEGSTKTSVQNELMKDKNERNFFSALCSGNLIKVQDLVDLVGPNTSKDSVYPLMIAVSEGFEEIVKLLLEKNADINAKNKNNETALHIGILKSRLSICALLIEKGADINTYNKKNLTPLALASELGAYDILKLLVRKPNSNLNLENSDGDTPLHLAINRSRIESVRILLEAGADIKHFNKKQFSPFHLAAFQGQRKILEMILKNAGSEIVNFQNDEQFTALHLAVLNDHKDCLKLLIDEKADINIKCKNGKSALHIAVYQKNFNCVKILVDKNAELNGKDNDGDTPLHYAMNLHNIENSMAKGVVHCFMTEILMENVPNKSSSEAEDILMYLVTKGAKVDIKNEEGNTVLDICKNDELKNKLSNLQIDLGEKKQSKSVDVPLLEEVNKNYEWLNEDMVNMNDKITCKICFDRPIGTFFFKCGHTSCEDCADELIQCHLCRSEIIQKFRIYF